MICIFHTTFQDNKDARHVKTYEVALKDKDFVEGPWSQNNLDNGAGLLIPVPAPLGGVIIIGEETIVYCNANATFKAIPIKQVVLSSLHTCILLVVPTTCWLVCRHSLIIYP